MKAQVTAEMACDLNSGFRFKLGRFFFADVFSISATGMETTSRGGRNRIGHITGEARSGSIIPYIRIGDRYR